MNNSIIERKQKDLEEKLRKMHKTNEEAQLREKEEYLKRKRATVLSERRKTRNLMHNDHKRKSIWAVFKKVKDVTKSTPASYWAAFINKHFKYSEMNER